jgi:hypothetical protein
MSKNLTRKGLALGALVALGASVFAGTPAFAADSLVLAPNYSVDSTAAVPVTEKITLNASLSAGSVAANISQLKYKITPPSGSIVDYGVENVASPTQAVGSQTANDGTSVVVAATSPSATTTNTITLKIDAATSSTSTKSVTVTAFLDANNNGALDSGETQQALTVQFIKYSEITTSTTITTPTAGDTSVSAAVKFTNVNNQALAASAVGAYFTKGDGTTLIANGAKTGTVAAGSGTAVTYTSTAHGFAAGDVVTITGAVPTTYNGTFQIASVPTADTFTVASTVTTAVTTAAISATRVDGVKAGIAYSTSSNAFKYTYAGVTALAKASAVKVQPLYNPNGVTTNSSNSIGSAQTASVATRVLGSFAGNHVLSTTAANDGTASGSSTAPATGSVTNTVALNTEKQVYFLAKDTASTPAALAGQSVSISVSTNGALSATNGISLTVNGTTYTSTSALPGATGVAKIAATTDANGKVFVTYKTVGFSNGNTVTITAVDENSTATVIGTETTRAYTTYIANNEGDTAVTTDNTPVTLNLVTLDQFGGVPADGTYQISATAVSDSQTTASTNGTGSDTYAAVTGGKTTLTLADNGSGTGNEVFGLTRYTLNSNGVVSAPTGFTGTSITAASWGAIGGSYQFTLAVKSAADIAAGEVLVAGNTTLSSTTGIYSFATGGSNVGASDTLNPLTYSAFANVDGRAIAVTAPSNKALDGTTTVSGVAITGTVNSASTATYAGVYIPSALVTVSGTGLEFSATQDGKTLYGDGTLSFYANASGVYTFNVWSHLAGKQLVTITSGTGSAKVYVYNAAAVATSAANVSVVVGGGIANAQAGRSFDVVATVTDKFGNPVVTAATNSAADAGILTLASTGVGYLATDGAVVTGSTGTFKTKLITTTADLGTTFVTATVDLSTDISNAKSVEFGLTDADVLAGGHRVFVDYSFAKGKTLTVTIDGKRAYSQIVADDNNGELAFTQKKKGAHVVTVRISGGIIFTEHVTTN